MKSNFYDPKILNEDKIELINETFKRFNIKSFADLGGVWGVDGGYTFYALENFPIEKAILVDTNFTQSVLKKRNFFPYLNLIEGNFGDENIISKIGNVDAIIFFDVLLHQVDPDWDKILQLYSEHANYIIIFNQQFISSEKTVRLIELGENGYFENVPHNKNEEPYLSLFQKLDHIHPQHNRKIKDIHNIWQWGIVDSDLYKVMKNLGFVLLNYKNCGCFGNLHSFENHIFIFYKTNEETLENMYISEIRGKDRELANTIRLKFQKEQILTKAIKLIEEKNYSNAKILINDLNHFEDSNPEYYYYLGLLEFYNEKYDSAIDYFKKRLELGLPDYNVCYYMAKCLENKGSEDIAKIYYQKADNYKK